MKKLITITATVALTLLVGVAYAIEVDGLEVTGAYIGRALNDDEMGVKGAAPGGIREEVLAKSTRTWESLFGSESVVPGDPVYGGPADHDAATEGMKGAAPGGLRDTDRGDSVIDFLSPPSITDR